MERAFGPEQKLLQRERKSAAGWLWGAAYGTVLAIALGFLVALAWGVHRVSRSSATRRGSRASAQPGGPPSTSTSSSSPSATDGDDHGEPAPQHLLRQPLADQRPEQRADAGRAPPARP